MEKPGKETQNNPTLILFVVKWQRWKLWQLQVCVIISWNSEGPPCILPMSVSSLTYFEKLANPDPVSFLSHLSWLRNVVSPQRKKRVKWTVKLSFLSGKGEQLPDLGLSPQGFGGINEWSRVEKFHLSFMFWEWTRDLRAKLISFPLVWQYLKNIQEKVSISIKFQWHNLLIWGLEK